jgi:signal transduction histidine kinase
VLVWVLVVGACGTLSVAAFLLRGDPEQAGSGLLLYAAAACLALSIGGPLPGEVGDRIGAITTWWAVLPLGIVLLTYPGQRVVRPWHGWLLGAVAVDFVLLVTVDELLPRSLSPTGRLVHAAIDTALSWGGVVLPVLVCAALVQRLRRAAEPERKAVRSVAIVGLALAASFAVRLGTYPLGETGAVAVAHDVALVLNLTCLGLAPVGLLIEALRRRAARASMIESLLRAGSDPARIQAAMARALSDPSVRLGFPLEGPGPVLVDVDGDRTDFPSGRPGRIRRELRSAEGVTVAVAEADETTTRDPAQLRVVLASAALSLDNARLQVRLIRSLEEVGRSRTRIVEAATQARRRLERDLHDGAQQQLLAVSAALARAEIVDGDGARARALSDARAQLSAALVELRRLARGIHPALLSQGGLSAALPTLADSAPVPVQVDVPAGPGDVRFSAPVETTLWFVAAEATTNAVKHSGATRIRLRLRADGERAVLSIEDDGRGGARLVADGGLAGLADRVSALGGTLAVTSTATAGTCVEAVVPCAS